MKSVMKKIGTLIIGLSILFSGFVKAQEVEIKKEDFTNKDEYKIAKDNLKQAEELYLLGRGGYKRALDFYIPVQTKNSQ